MGREEASSRIGVANDPPRRIQPTLCSSPGFLRHEAPSLSVHVARRSKTRLREHAQHARACLSGLDHLGRRVAGRSARAANNDPYQAHNFAPWVWAITKPRWIVDEASASPAMACAKPAVRNRRASKETADRRLPRSSAMASTLAPSMSSPRNLRRDRTMSVCSPISVSAMTRDRSRSRPARLAWRLRTSLRQSRPPSRSPALARRQRLLPRFGSRDARLRDDHSAQGR